MSENNTEKRMQPKQLAAEFASRLGVKVSERFIRSMLCAGVRRIGYNARFSDVVEWWERNPDFSPRSKSKNVTIKLL